MQQKQLYDFADECVARLGELVGEMRKKGHEIGLTEAQTRKVWITCFQVLNKKARLSRQLMSQNLRRS